MSIKGIKWAPPYVPPLLVFQSGKFEREDKECQSKVLSGHLHMSLLFLYSKVVRRTEIFSRNLRS